MPTSLQPVCHPLVKLAIAVVIVLLALAIAPLLGAAGCENVPFQTWDLSTGSHLGYMKIAATGAPRTPVPTIVFVHGGPGACQVYRYGFARPWYERLAALGFDVYIYDQIGSGVSARLSDPRDYTVARHVADLEAIRREIGCERMTLIGESWGAGLVSNYMAAHPGRVERAIFVAPGPIDAAEWKRTMFPYLTPRLVPEMLGWIASTRGSRALERYTQVDALLQRGDIRGAYAFAGDAEMDALQDEFVVDTVLVTCVYDRAKLIELEFTIPGMGWWAGIMTTYDAVSRSRAVRARLELNESPVLILRGDADYLPLRVAEQYVETFSGATLVRIPEAGHFIWMDQPERYRAEIEQFLSSDRALELRNP